MRRSRFPGVDLPVYGEAVLRLGRNPTLIVVPLLMLIVGVLIGHLIAPFGGGLSGSLTAGLANFIVAVLGLFGFGSACILADDAWRRGRGSFEHAWTETQRRAGDLIAAAVGVTMIVTLALYVAEIFGSLTVGLVLGALAVYFLIFAMPAAAAGGAPGALSIQVSIDRVRSAPLAAAIATVVTIVLVGYLPSMLKEALTGFTATWLFGDALWKDLIGALFQSIALGYAALVLTKIFTDLSFTRRY